MKPNGVLFGSKYNLALCIISHYIRDIVYNTNPLFVCFVNYIFQAVSFGELQAFFGVDLTRREAWASGPHPLTCLRYKGHPVQIPFTNGTVQGIPGHPCSFWRTVTICFL